MTVASVLVRQASADLPPNPRRATARQIVGFVLRIVLSAALFAAALWATSATLDLRQLTVVGPKTLGLCLMLSALVVCLLACRWRFVVAGFPEHPDRNYVPDVASFVRLTWIGLAVNQVLPSVVGGDALRASLLAGQGVPAARAVGSVVVDRLCGLVGLALLCMAAMPLLGNDLFGSTLLAAAVTAVMVVVAAAAILICSRQFDRAKRLAVALRQTASLRRNLILIPMAIAGHLANVAIFLVMAHALGADLPILPATAVLLSVLLISVLPLSIAGWGLREFTLVQAFGNIGVEHDKIVLSSVAYGLFLLVTQALGFFLIVGRKRP